MGCVREWATRVESRAAGGAVNQQGWPRAPEGYWPIIGSQPCPSSALEYRLGFPFLLVNFFSFSFSSMWQF
jgi:hypothetical protein